MVISSSGGAAQLHGGALGQFEYHEDKGYYVQTSTDQSDEKFQARYLYRDKDDFWSVSDTPGDENSWLHNPNPSPTPPASGWLYADGGYHDDPTLFVTPGPLPHLPRQFTVTATGAAEKKWPLHLGVFTRTERWWLGRPMYVNTEGALLYYGGISDYGWVIGPKLGYSVLRGSKAYHSPASEDSYSWSYYTGSESGWKPTSVTVTGKD